MTTHPTSTAGSTAADRPHGRRRVVMWRDYWLAPSETFIRETTTALTRWEPVLVGRRQFDTTLMTADVAPYSDRFAGRLASRLPAGPRARRGWRDAVADPRVGLVHAHFGQDGLSALPWARAAGKPLIVSIYGMDVTSLPWRRGADGRRFRAGLAELFDYASALVPVSQFLADRTVELGADPAKVRLIYPALGLDHRPAPAGDAVGIVFVGRLVEKKGVPDLLAAVARLPEPLRSVPVTVVGYGPLRDELERQAADLDLRVTFAGRRSSAEVAEILREHAVFCGPSQRAANGDAEGLGMVFVEASNAGLPVVTYRHGGVPEVVADGETGLTVPEGDVAALSNALARVLADPEWGRRLGRAGQQRVNHLFDRHRHAAHLEALYDEVAAPLGATR
ncbi:glycosyltransferase [Nakamurella flava]|uniref:Glycosyltransferase n=1 Tax=Nakamurella flava TaxID=2576308 RepID=A0A4U6QNM4_9ACTN|nr:glycosyltransferase [Nakamurella flava]TKV61798.1 glycosyltransferase [Nakamurella flava]